MSEEERLILKCYAEGLTDAEIARLLWVSETAVQCRARKLRQRLGATTRAHSVALAMREGWIH